MVENARTNLLSPEEHQAVTQAIRAAERRTSGEVFAVLARASDDYMFVCGFFAGAWILLAGLSAAAVAALAGGVRLDGLALLMTMGLAYAALLALFAFAPGLRMWAVPAAVARRRASAEAARQFLAHGIADTRERTGVLVFVSLAERHAEVVADSAVAALVDDAAWQEAVAALTRHASEGTLAQGFVEAVGICGEVLATHFPPGPEPRGELDDRLVEL